MTDIAADTTTTAAVAVGGSATGEIETAADKDWFEVELEAGRTYRFDLQGAPGGHGTLSDTFLRRILDAEGNKSTGDGQHRTYNDDFQGSRDSQVTFTATEAGTYYVEASGDRDETGTYRLTVTDVTPVPVVVTDVTPEPEVVPDVTPEPEVVADVTPEPEVVADVTPEPEVVADVTPEPEVVADVTPEPEVEEPERQITRPPFGEAGPLSVSLFTRPPFGEAGPPSVSLFTRPPFGEAGPLSVSLFETGFPDAQVFPDQEEPLVSQQQSAGDDYSAFILTTGTVAVGGSVTGVIGEGEPGLLGRDVDWFKVELLDGRTYRIDLEGASPVVGAPDGHGTLPDPFIRGIYDAEGQKVPGASTNNDGGEGRNARLLFAPDTGGTYYIAASSILQNDTGTYRLSVTEAEDFSTIKSSAKTVEVGDVDNPPTGLIASDRERAWFAVELEGGASYRIEMEGVDDALPGGALAYPAVFAVYDGGGDQVDHISRFRGEKVAVLDIEPPTQGTYYIVLGRAAVSSSGRYRLSVTKTDDYPADIRTAGTVEVGGFATGEIETVGDVDWFKVTLVAQVEYRIDVLGSPTKSGTLSDPRLVAIYNSESTLVADTSSNEDRYFASYVNSRVVFEPPNAGIYYIAVRGEQGGTGTYRVQVKAPVTGDDYVAGFATTGSVEVGGFATGNKETTDDRDWFAVELLAGVEYRIDLMGGSTTSGTMDDPLIYGVYESSGPKLPMSGNNDGGEGKDSRLSNFRVNADGTHYIEVGSGNGFTPTFDSTGTYRLSVTATSVFGVVKHAATDIMVGDSATGDIEQSGERDWFKIQLLAGVQYQIDIEGANFAGTDTTDGTLRDPYLQGIYKPNGTKIPGTEKNDGGVGYNTRFLFVPEEDGTYYIATAGNAHYTGTFRLTVAIDRSVYDDDYSANTGTTGMVAVPDSVTGNIDYDGDRDWVAVQLEADTEYRFDLKGQSSGSGTLWDPQIHGVYDKDGNEIADTSNNNSGTGADSKLIFTSGDAGAYYIAAGHANTAFNHTGTYTLTVQKAGDDYPGGGNVGGIYYHHVSIEGSAGRRIHADSNDIGTVAVDGSTTGNLEDEWDRDFFRFNLDQGETYRIHVKGADTGDGTLADPYIHRLYKLGAAAPSKENPESLDRSDNNGGTGRNSRLDFAPDSNGVYAISVQAWNSRDTGTYTVEVEEVM